MADPKTAADVADHALTQIDKVGDLASQFAIKLTELAHQQAPAAWEMAKGVARISALSEIMTGLELLAYSSIAGIIGYKLIKLGIKIQSENKNPYNSDPGIFWVGVGSCAVLLSLATLGASFLNLFDVWAWIGMFKPELWIAQHFLKF